MLIFLLVSAITALSVYAIERGEHERENAELRERAQAVASALERRSSTTSAYLRAGAALFSTVDTVTPQLFNRFTGNLLVEPIDRGTEGLGWAVRLRPDQLSSFEAQYREMTGIEVSVYPQAVEVTDQIVPVTYLQPASDRNRRAYGFDMYSEPVRRQAMDDAAESGEPVVSGRVVLKQEGVGTAAGFIMYMPVFQAGRSPRPLKGFIYSPINARTFVDSALALETRGEKGLRLYDREISPDRLLVEIPPKEKTGNIVSEPVMIGNHEMVLEIESALGNSLSRLSMLTLLFGLLVASLLMVLARLLTRQALEDHSSLARLQEQNSIRDNLTRELNHRVKNTLANVLSIISLTRRRASSLDQFADSLDGRIRALSATHDLLTQSEWGATPIRALVETELTPYANQSDQIVEMRGPAVEIAPNDALSLGLAIHELATNAAKYGALSKSGGSVSVTWEMKGEDFVQIDWAEAGGPPVSASRKAGFGTNLIEKIVAHELRSPVKLNFDPAGVTCSLTVPVRPPSDFAIRAGRQG
ncbi:CHASE domain-containing protein [Pontixanthobacter gangjinensis]|uniref:CHASE domain-containing protein n=1 Tax=Pontixanthobacter gangjinensis TaxID=1028742 RepID=UPI002E269FA6